MAERSPAAMPVGSGPAGRWAGPLALAALAAAAFAVYERAPGRVADGAALPYALALGLGPGLAFAWLRVRGARGREAVAGGALLPALWLGKELWRMHAVYPLAETLFYLLNPVCLGLVALAALEMALAELAIRRARGMPLRPGSAPALVLGVGLGAALALAWLALHGDAPRIFYAYVDLYGMLFGR